VHNLNDIVIRLLMKPHAMTWLRTGPAPKSFRRASNVSRCSAIFLHCRIFLVIPLLALPSLGSETPDPVALIVSELRSQHYDEAISAANSALKAKPRDFRVWTLKGIALSQKGEVPAALMAFQSALALSPNYPAALRAEAKLFYETGDKRAIPILRRILKTDPGDQSAHEMLAVEQAKQDLCTAALSQFQFVGKVIELHPNSLQWYGFCLMSEKRTADALAVFERIVQLVPKQPYPRYNLALVQTMAGKNAEAIQTLQPLLSAQAPDPDVLSLAAEADEANGDTPSAVALLRQAIILDPTNEDLYVRFAGLCLNHDSFQAGIDMIDAGLKRIPKAAGLYIGRGLLYGQLAQYEKAERDFETAEQLNPADSTSSYALAATEVQNGELDQAQEAIERKLVNHPNVASLHFMLAKILIDRGAKAGTPEFRRAMDSALLAIRLKPDLAPARDVLASMYLSLGQNALAAQQCRLALEANPSDQSALYHLIEALRSSEQKAELQVLVKRLLALQHPDQESDSRRYKIISHQVAPE
jgi:tetratricopeptide (TPR) repeat protein